MNDTGPSAAKNAVQIGSFNGIRKWWDRSMHGRRTNGLAVRKTGTQPTSAGRAIGSLSELDSSMPLNRSDRIVDDRNGDIPSVSAELLNSLLSECGCRGGERASLVGVAIGSGVAWQVRGRKSAWKTVLSTAMAGAVIGKASARHMALRRANSIARALLNGPRTDPFTTGNDRSSHRGEANAQSELARQPFGST